ncbi:hypothetical protein [Sphingobium vermicomposti]|uniref:Uncharacterized protein n=1 Tax=Sphingobium vermicomposti TaxID=529005 RepID=A0A846M2Y7_9SPHN|nr:hypothetical protein [Sphingobium vermicomposti]NIJ16282.1 hypothetical protein [Sphingobium vermicomposti]
MAAHGSMRCDLPWGWWLRAEPRGFVDDEENVWSSVRDAFWRGRLGFQSPGEPEHFEMMLRVMTSMGSRQLNPIESKHDLFENSILFWRFYMLWLGSTGLANGTVHDASLTEEGRSALAMLQATRDPAWVDLPMSSVVDAVRMVGQGAAEKAREASIQQFEAQTSRLPWIFSRERVGTRFLITLTGLARDSRMPTKRVFWSQDFAGNVARDDFFGWLAERVERWEDWGEFAYSEGAGALTQRFLQLVIASNGLTGRR